MNVETLPYLIPYFVSAFISALVAYYAWLRRRVPGSKPFVVVALSQVVWTVAYAFELASPTLQGKLFWDDVQFFASLVWPIAFLAFVSQFCDHHWKRPHIFWSIISSPAFLFSFLLLTNRWHSLIRADAWLIPGEPFDVLYYDFSLAVYAYAVYLYSIVGFGYYILLKTFFRAHKLFRKQVLFVLIGVMIPLLGSSLGLVGITFSGQRDTTPLTFALSNLIIAWALYRYKLFDIVPIARDKVVENMSDLVFVVDAHNRFVDINPAAEEILGRSNGEVIGHQSEDVLAEWAHLLTLLGGEQETVAEVDVAYQKELYYLAVKVTPLYDDEGELNGRLIVARDITEMKLAEQKLQEHATQLEFANEELLALSELKDEFVANVSHELRTPLANLNLYHDLLLRNPARMLTYTEILQRETNRLKAIIEDLLALSRLDREDGIVRFEETDLNTLAETLVHDRQRLAAKAGIDLQFKAASDCPPVTIDASMITQALAILITNSMNYTPEGGDIIVFTQLKQENKPWIGLCVQDTGYGITADEQVQLFNRFFRGEASRQVNNAGTGLGLSIAKEIVDRHQGRIEVQSTGIPGDGTCVSIWLPLAEESNIVETD